MATTYNKCKVCGRKLYKSKFSVCDECRTFKNYGTFEGINYVAADSIDEVFTKKEGELPKTTGMNKREFNKFITEVIIREIKNKK